MNNRLRGWKSTVLAGCWMAAGGVALADWPQPPENIQEHVIPLGDGSPTVEAVRNRMAAALAAVKTDGSAPPAVLATADKGYLLCGDLFGTGTCFALYETKAAEALEATMALAERTDTGWTLRGLWKIPLTWVPDDDRWSGTDRDYVESDTLRAPFELEDLIDDKVPELIVAGEKPKYRQVRYVMHFNKMTRGLDLLAYSMVRPIKVGHYLRLYRASANKAIWSEWTFLEWRNGKPAIRAVWHSESPHNNVAPPFHTAWAPGGDGAGEEFRIIRDGNLEVTKNGLPFAELAIKWNAGEPHREWDLMLGAWLFERLTGLPRENFPERHGPEQADKPKLEKLEEHAEIQVIPGSGTPGAKLQFSLPHS